MSRFVVYRPEAQMDAADRALAAKWQSAIGNAALLAGMDFDRAPWSYRQLDCEAIPGHLFLLYESDSGPGGMSLFSASIPRAGSGDPLIIPIERRGFTLFSPAPVNSLAIDAFNRIRAEEPKGPPADWLSTSLCYAALTAPRGDIALSPQEPEDANLGLLFPPTLEHGQRGEWTVRFVDVASARRAMQWALTYDAEARLLKVEDAPAPMYATRIIPKN